MAGSVGQSVFVSGVMVGMLYALVRSCKTPEVVVFLALLIVWNAGMLSNEEALSGFHNPGVLVIGALFVVMKAIEKSRVADKAARRILGLRTSFTWGFLRLMALTLFISAFLNNTPVVALLIPVTRDWARTRGFSPACFLMPMSFVSAFGGLLTVVGGGTNLVIQGLLFEAGREDPAIRPLHFFEPVYVGLPLAIAGITYLVFAAPRLLGPRALLCRGRYCGGGGGGAVCGVADTSVEGGVSYVGDRSEELLTEVEIMSDSELVDQPVALILGRVGLPASALVCLRRCRWRRTPGSPGTADTIPSTRHSTSFGTRTCNSTGEHERDVDLDVGSDRESAWAGRRGGARGARVVGDVVGKVAAAAATGAAAIPPAGKGLLPFALRRRAYARLESDGSDALSAAGSGTDGATITRSTVVTKTKATDVLCIEMAPMTRSVAHSVTEEDEEEQQEAARMENSDVGCGSGGISDVARRNVALLNDDDGHGCNNSNKDRNKTNFDVTEEDDFENLYRFPFGEQQVRAGDVLVLSCTRAQMLDFQGSIVSQPMGAALRVLGISTQALPRHGTVFFELVLSSRSHFVGRSARRDKSFFAERYGCSVVAFRLKGSRSVEEGSSVISSSAAGKLGWRGIDGLGVGQGNGYSPLHAVSSLTSPPPQPPPPPPPPPSRTEHLNKANTATVDGVSIEKAEAFWRGGDGDGIDGTGGLTEDNDIPTMVDSPLHVHAPPTPLPPVSLPVGIKPTAGAGGTASAAVGASMTTAQDLGCSAGIGFQRQCKGQEQGRGWGRGRRRGEGFLAGDVVLVLGKEDLLDRFSLPREFLLKTKVGRLPEPTSWFQYLPLAVFAMMLVWVLVSDVSMVRAAFAACAVLILGGWVSAERAVGYVDWSLLLLIGSALGFSKAIANSGLAGFAGDAIRESGMSRSASVYVLFAFTMICTELVTNNAAAALSLPIALSMAQEMEASYKPYVMAVLVAASCSFLTPIGTPTNTMVWKPGGYKFQEYVKLGAPLAIMYWLGASALIPVFFPF